MESHWNYHSVLITLKIGDISLEEADAVVNAANASLAGGGGVDGAIHRRGGPSIMAETDRLYPNGCPTGDAVITGAGNLSAQYVIHTVAPRYFAEPECSRLLASAYRNSLECGAKAGCRTVAFPSLGTGAYRYPLNEAAAIALAEVKAFIDSGREKTGKIAEIRFVLFDAGTFGYFQKAGEAVFGAPMR